MTVRSGFDWGSSSNTIFWDKIKLAAKTLNPEEVSNVSHFTSVFPNFSQSLIFSEFSFFEFSFFLFQNLSFFQGVKISF